MKTGFWKHPFVMMSGMLVMWGSYAAVSKMAISRLDSFQVLFCTFGVSWLIFTLLLTANGRIKALKSLSYADVARALLNGIPFYLYYLLYSLAMNRIPVVEASMLNYFFPVFIVLLSVPMFGEKLNGLKAVSILLAFLGMLLIVTNGSLTAIHFTNAAGDLLALAAALSWAFFSVLGKRNTNVDQDLAIYLYTVSAFALSTIGVLGFSTLASPDLPTLGMTVWLALSNIVLGNLLWFRALKSLSSTMVAAVSYLSPFATLLFIAVFLGERVNPSQIAGFLVILAGLAVQWIPMPNKRHPVMKG